MPVIAVAQNDCTINYSGTSRHRSVDPHTCMLWASWYCCAVACHGYPHQLLPKWARFVALPGVEGPALTYLLHTQQSINEVVIAR